MISERVAQRVAVPYKRLLLEQAKNFLDKKEKTEAKKLLTEGTSMSVMTQPEIAAAMKEQNQLARAEGRVNLTSVSEEDIANLENSTPDIQSKSRLSP